MSLPVITSDKTHPSEVSAAHDVINELGLMLQCSTLNGVHTFIVQRVQ